MKIKMIQVNILGGMFLDKLVEYLRAEAPDIITMQEVSGGAENNWNDTTLDIFEHLKQQLGLEGVLAKMHEVTGAPHAYFGNAVFVRGTILSRATLWMREKTTSPHRAMEMDGRIGRSLIDCAVRVQGTALHVLCYHGEITNASRQPPTDTPEKIRQADLVRQHLKSLVGAPFLLGCDSNMVPGSETIRTIERAAENPTTLPPSTITTTIHPTIHKTHPHLVCDFIFTSKHFRAVSIEAPVVPISDHLPVVGVFTYTPPNTSKN